MRDLDLLSVVVPCHNEEEILEWSHGRLTDILKKMVAEKKCLRYEVVYINDGSTDGTTEILEKLFQKDFRTRVVELRRNFGLQGAISAGLSCAEGEAVVTIDCDLQDPPEKITDMIRFFRDGYDLVIGVREDRSTDPFLKRVSAEGYYRFLAFLGVEVVHNHGDFRLMSRGLVDEFNRMPERNRLIRAMIFKLDNRYAVVSYRREKRTAGTTKFNFARMFSLSLDGIFSFSYAPLRVASFIGFLVFFSSIIGIAIAVYAKIKGHVVPGWTSIVLAIMMFGGLQFLFLGIMGEYIGRLYTEVKERPLFSIRRELKRPKP